MAQSFGDFELIAIDDASHQRDCVEIVQDYMRSDKRIRCIQLPENQGLAAGRNLGLAEAQAPYFAMLDDDGFYGPDKLKIQYEFLQQHPSVVGCSTGLYFINRQGEITGNNSLATNQIFPPENSQDISRHIANHSFMGRTEQMRAVGYRSWFSYCAEDWDLSKRLEERFSLAILSAPLYHYRQHQYEMTRKPLCMLYVLAAQFSARFRRLRLPDPITEGTDLWDILALAPVLHQHDLPWGKECMDEQIRFSCNKQIQDYGNYEQAALYLRKYNQILASFPTDTPDLPPPLKLDITPVS